MRYWVGGKLSRVVPYKNNLEIRKIWVRLEKNDVTFLKEYFDNENTI